MLEVLLWVDLWNDLRLFNIFLGHFCILDFLPSLIVIEVLRFLVEALPLRIVHDRAQVLHVHQVVGLKLVDLRVSKRASRSACEPAPSA